MATINRKAKKFRYDGDPEEIMLGMTVTEATMLLAAIVHAEVDDDSLIDVRSALRAVLDG